MVKLSALLALCALATVTEAVIKDCKYEDKETVSVYAKEGSQEYMLNEFEVEAPQKLPPYKVVYGDPERLCRVVQDGSLDRMRCDVVGEARSDYMKAISLNGEKFEICGLFFYGRLPCDGGQEWNEEFRRCETPGPTCASNQKVVYGQCQCRFGLDLQGNCLNSRYCPANSVLRGGRCTCNSGYKVSDNRCIISKTCGHLYKLVGGQCVCQFGLNVDGRTCLTGTAPGSCPANSVWNPNQCRCKERYVVQPGNQCHCAPNMFQKDGKCHCNKGFEFRGGRCAARRCPHGRQFMEWLGGCMCEQAENFNGMCCFKFGAGNVAAGMGFCCGGNARIVNHKCECMPDAKKVHGGSFGTLACNGPHLAGGGSGFESHGGGMFNGFMHGSFVNGRKRK